MFSAFFWNEAGWRWACPESFGNRADGRRSEMHRWPVLLARTDPVITLDRRLALGHSCGGWAGLRRITCTRIRRTSAKSTASRFRALAPAVKARSAPIRPLDASALPCALSLAGWHRPRFGAHRNLVRRVATYRPRKLPGFVLRLCFAAALVEPTGVYLRGYVRAYVSCCLLR